MVPPVVGRAPGHRRSLDGGGGDVQGARAAVEFLTAALPEAQRACAQRALLTDLEALYVIAGPPPPEWLDLLREYFAPPPHEESSAEECGG